MSRIQQLSNPTAERPRRGRPRSVAIDDAVLSTTLKLIAELGYIRMTIDGVAREAGVGKPTIYRRWPSKIELASAAIDYLHRIEEQPLTGDTYKDLTHELTDVHLTYQRLNGMSFVGTLLEEERHHPQLIRTWRARVASKRRRRLAQIFEQGIANGELRADTDVVSAVHMAIGSMYAAYIAGEPLSPKWPDDVVEMIISAVAVGSRRNSTKAAV